VGGAIAFFSQGIEVFDDSRVAGLALESVEDARL
jgi:hypothetical protein